MQKLRRKEYKRRRRAKRRARQRVPVARMLNNVVKAYQSILFRTYRLNTPLIVNLRGDDKYIGKEVYFDVLP